MPAHLGDVAGEPLLPARHYIIRDGHCVAQRVAQILAVSLVCSIGAVMTCAIIVYIAFL